MSRKRRVLGAGLKSKVALAAVQGDKSLKTDISVDLAIWLAKAGLSLADGLSSDETVRQLRVGVLNHMALTFDLLNKPDKAAETCRRALAIDPRNPYALQLLGSSFL